MASRINTKVVVPLIIALFVLVGGVMGLAYFTIYRSPEFYKSRGDAAAAAGDWRTAEKFYSKGVNRDQGNIELLDLWREAIEHIVPTDAIEAVTLYQTATGIIQKKPLSRPFEPQFHIDWLNRVLVWYPPQNAAYLASQAEKMLEGKPSSDTNPLWEQVYRFRGIANTYRMGEVGLDPQVRDQALTDLDRWLAGHPDDSMAVDAKIMWHFFDAKLLLAHSKPREALARADEALAIATDYLKTHPDEVLIHDALAESWSLRGFIAKSVPDEQTNTLPQMRESLRTAERLALAQPDLPRFVARRLAGDLIYVDDDSGKALMRSARLIEHAMERHPDDPELRFDRAGFLSGSNQKPESMAAFEQIIDAPNLPVSYESIRLFDLRPRAVKALFDMAIDQWRNTGASDTAAVASARAVAQSRIDQYRALRPGSDPQLLYMEGRFALADRKPEIAANRLNQYLTSVGRTDVAALFDLAVAMEQSNRPGAAYEFLAEIDTLNSGRNVPVIQGMIKLDIASRNFDRAKTNLDRLTALDPDSDETRQLRNMVAVGQNGVEANVENDAALSAILEARELQMNGQMQEARALLLKMHESAPQDLQVLYTLALLERSDGHADKALEYVSQALAVFPQSEQWRILQAVLSKSDLRPVLSQIVDQRPGLSEFDRHVGKWRLFAANDFSAEAQSEFEAAKAINPDNPEIIEQDFATAMLAQDMLAAQSAMRHAQATNADLANGLTFRGRYELQSGDTAAAIATLLQATTLKPYDSAAWRFLGVAYREAGNYDAAMSAFSKSLDKEPSNVITLKELSSLQIRRQEFSEALKTARRAMAVAPNDSRIAGEYLLLEGQFGDRASVIRTRERALNVNPAGIDNALALVTLYELDKRFDDAKKVLDSLAPEDQADQLRVVQARAVWHARQDQIDEGRAALEAFTRLSPPPSNAVMMRAMLSLIQYDVNAGQPDQAIETAKSAVRYQDPTVREADRSLGEIYRSLNRTEEALEAFEHAFVSSKDSPGLDLQLINLHLSVAQRVAATDAAAATQHRKRAAALLDENEKALGTSADSVLLRGELAFQSGDMAAAERLYNDAVARYPQDARVYGARAKFNLTQLIATNDIGRANRIRADAEQSIGLNPGNTAPLITLIDLAKARRNPQTGQLDPDVDALISTWRRILKIDPRNESIRGDLVATLYAKREFTAARSLIQEAIDLNPARGAWYEIRGDLEFQTGAPPQTYVSFYLQAVEKEPSANRVEKLARGLLAFEPPHATEVQKLYLEFEKQVSGLPSIRMLLAQALGVLKDQPGALSNLREAATQILGETNPTVRDRLIKDWYEAMGKVAPSDQMSALSTECLGSFDDPWPQGLLGYTLYLASSNPGVPDAAALRQAGIEQMAAARTRIEALPRSEERTRILQQEIGWNLSGAYYAAGDSAKAVEVWRWLLEVAPNHFQTLNNLAFALAHDLNEPVAALEPAKRAYDSDPADPTVLDTYGYVLFRNSRLDEAERLLRDSTTRKEGSGNRMHLGQVLAAEGRVQDARRELDRARTLALQEKNAARVNEVDELLKSL